MDISGSLVRLAYNLRKLDAPAGDLYAPDRIVSDVWTFCDDDDRKTIRALIKTATQICFNAATRKKAIGAVDGELKKHRRQWPMTKLPNAAELVRRIALLHYPVVDEMFGDVAMKKLIPAESGIMFVTIREFVLGLRKPALAIHDGLRVKKSDAKLARDILQNAYFSRTGFSPVIKG